jgi:hypothetical protein
MKGFQEQTQGEGTFFVIKHNSIVQESKTERPGFEQIKVTNPRTNQEITKYIKRYKVLEALVRKIEWYDTEQKYEQRYIGWKLHLDTGEKKGVLDIPFDSRVCSRFMNLAENLDFTQPVEFSAWRDASTDSTAFAVKQNDQSVLQKYTRANPGDRPEPVQNFKGKWNYDDQMEFLRKRMIDVVIPAVDAANANVNGNSSNGNGADHTETADAENSQAGELLDTIKNQLKELSEAEKNHSKSEHMANWFGVHTWSEIEKIPAATLKVVSKKLDDHLCPF